LCVNDRVSYARYVKGNRALWSHRAYGVGFTLLQKERIDMSILYSILDLSIIVVISVGVAVLVVSLGKWKIKMGLLPRFKNFTMPRRHERGGISEHSDLPTY
jgi:hypothetical protein